MANFATIQDIIEYALFRSGEWTRGSLTDGDYYNGSDGGPVLDYINDVVEGLILGSPLGLTDERGMPLPGVDWQWAKKQPPAVLNLSSSVTTGTVTATSGSTTLVFSTTLSEGDALVGTFIVGTGVVGGPLDLSGWRIRIGSSAFLPRIVSSEVIGGLTVATLDEGWPDVDQTASTYTLLKLEYDMASDFVRFDGQPTTSYYPYSFPVVSADALEQVYPICLTKEGDPRAASLVAPQRIRLSHCPTVVQRIEYNYIYLPDRLTLASTDLILPPHQRRILGLGAAFFICFDKADTKAGDLKAEFSGLYSSMVSEFGRHHRKMSRNFGIIKYRLDQTAEARSLSLLRTASGLIIGP